MTGAARARRARLFVAATGAAALVLAAWLSWRVSGGGRAAALDGEVARCGPGFHARGARCCPGERAGSSVDGATGADLCAAPDACPPPLAIDAERGACLAPPLRILVPETEVLIGPSDWEAEGRVPARRVHAGPFYLDAFEVSIGRYRDGFPREREAGDLARAVSGVTPAEASAHCASEGGRLPTEAEWIVAAAGPSARRYAWGDTGAVCRRAAFGLEKGPCARGAAGPDTVGSRAAGASASGLFDLTGNVAELVTGGADATGVDAMTVGARGGSWRSGLATELRTWAEIRVGRAARDGRDPRVGFRCAYDVASTMPRKGPGGDGTVTVPR